MKCDGCEVDMVDVQAKMAFRGLPAEQDWSELTVFATVCPKYRKMEFRVAVPTQFALWIRG